ncbi:uncharacterized protein M6G45_008037 [Spheniscus humboldti]
MFGGGRLGWEEESSPTTLSSVWISPFQEGLRPGGFLSRGNRAKAGAFHVILLFWGEDPKGPHVAGRWEKWSSGTRKGGTFSVAWQRAGSESAGRCPPILTLQGGSSVLYQPETGASYIPSQVSILFLL